MLVTQCFDDEGNGSELFRAVEDDIIERIDVCEGSQDKQVRTGVIRNKTETVKVCGALGTPPHVSEFPGFVDRFNRGLSELDDTAEIDHLMTSIEYRRPFRIVYAASALTIVSCISMSAGAITGNNLESGAGIGGLLTGVGIITVMSIKHSNSQNQ